MRRLFGALATLALLIFGWPVAKDGFVGSVVFVGTLSILAFWWWAELKFR